MEEWLATLAGTLWATGIVVWLGWMASVPLLDAFPSEPEEESAYAVPRSRRVPRMSPGTV